MKDKNKNKNIHIFGVNRAGIGSHHQVLTDDGGETVFVSEDKSILGHNESFLYTAVTNETDSGLKLIMTTSCAYKRQASVNDADDFLGGGFSLADPQMIGGPVADYGPKISAPEIRLEYNNYAVTVGNCFGAFWPNSLEAPHHGSSGSNIIYDLGHDILWSFGDSMFGGDNPTGGVLPQFQWPEYRRSKGATAAAIRFDMKLGPVDISISDGYKYDTDFEASARMNVYGGILELAYDKNDKINYPGLGEPPGDCTYISYRKTIGNNTYDASYGGNGTYKGYSVRAKIKDFLNNSNNSLYLYANKKIHSEYSVQGLRYNYKLSDDVVANAGFHLTNGTLDFGTGIQGTLIDSTYDF